MGPKERPVDRGLGVKRSKKDYDKRVESGSTRSKLDGLILVC